MKYVSKLAMASCIHSPRVSNINMQCSSDGINNSANISSSGRGMSLRASLHSAIGEWLDRTALCQTPNHTANFKELTSCQKSRLKESDLLGCFSDEILNSIDYIYCRRLLDGKVFALPRSFFFFEELNSSENAARVLPSCDTTGCSSHFSLEVAIENSIAEIIEKNSICAAFNNGMTRGMYPHQFVLNLLTQNLREWVQFWTGSGLSVYCFDISFIENTPAALSLWLSADQQRVLGIGAACCKGTAAAINSSILESYQLMHFYCAAKSKGTDTSEDYYLEKTQLPAEDWVPFLKDKVLERPKTELNENAFDWFKQSEDAFFYVYPQRTFPDRVVVKVLHTKLIHSLVPAPKSWCCDLEMIRKAIHGSKPKRFPFP